MFEAFGRVRAKCKDAFLFIHAEPRARGVNRGLALPTLAVSCGLPDQSVRFTLAAAFRVGMPAERVAELYSAFDVLANPSYGEGFGVPIVEAQACGTPVILTDWTAMGELCGDGWLVRAEPWFDVHQGAFYDAPSVASIVDCLEQAYEARGDVGLRNQAREFALAYDANRVVTEHLAAGARTVRARRREGTGGGVSRALVTFGTGAHERLLRGSRCRRSGSSRTATPTNWLSRTRTRRRVARRRG